MLHNTTEKYKVRIAYRSNIEESQLPTSNQTLNLQFTVTYRQATTDAVPKTFTGTIYAYNYNQVTIGDTIPTTNTYWIMYVSTDSEPLRIFPYYYTYSNEAECTALVGQIVDSYSGKRVRYCAPSQSIDPEDLRINYYLKYELTNGVVTDIHACFLSDKEYCLSGGSSAYQNNVSILNSTPNRTWFENNGFGCNGDSSSFQCSSTIPMGLTIQLYADGTVQVWGVNSWLCQVWFDTDTNKMTSFCMQD